MPTTARILQITPVAQYLAADKVARGGLFGGTCDPKLPITIYMVYKIVKRVYDEDPAYSGIREVALYLYELIQEFAFRAAAIVDGNTGGQVAPPTPVALPDVLDFIVSASSIIPTGGSSLTIDSYIGYNLSFDRGGQPQYTTDPGDGSTYFSWNRTTGAFALLNGDAQEGERFRLTPIG